MVQKTAVFWFRRDLRLHDNHGLYQALKKEIPVLPVFIFDRQLLDILPSKSDLRVTFIYNQVLRLKQELEKSGSSLLILNSTPAKSFDNLLHEFEITTVYTNKDYEPFACRRDAEIEKFLHKKGIDFYQFKDHVIFEENEILNNSGNPYTMYTPYSRKWRMLFRERPFSMFSSEKLIDRFIKTAPFPAPSLNHLGFEPNSPEVPSSEISEQIIRNYEKTRDFPAIRGTTRLGVHLRYGTISIRELAHKAEAWSEVFLKELIWREFFISILWHFPMVENRSFKLQFERIRWRNNEKEFDRWCKGETGYPMIDAGMRELKETGFMHNRVRMLTAGFLSKHLLIDWRWGEAWFAENLLDYELASNNGNWQWAAGTGCDGAPWFRIFNPEIQQKKFDPAGEYVNKWVPEWGKSTYPKPVVEHKFARERALQVYKSVIY